MQLYKSHILSFILSLLFVVSQAQPVKWVETYPGVWKASIGKPESFNLLSVANVAPNKEALDRLGKSFFPLKKTDLEMKVVDGKTYLRFPLEIGEQLFGFGLNFQKVLQRGNIMELHVDHYGGVDNGRTHSPTPFFCKQNLGLLRVLR